MFTIYTTCKPCNIAENYKMQKQAMMSWTFLNPRPEVLIIGDDEGTPELAAELGFRHITGVQKSEFNTPLLNSIVELAEANTDNQHLCWVSADVFLFQDVVAAFEKLKEMPEFCGVCRKWQQMKFDDLDFSADWQSKIRENIRHNLVTSGDFYLTNRGFWAGMPPFVVGRCSCDTWMFWEARRRGCMVNLTEAVQIIDYMHEHQHWGNQGENERQINLDLAGSISGNVEMSNFWMTKDLQICPVSS